MLALWVLKIFVCDVPVLRLGYDLLLARGRAIPLRVASVHSSRGRSGREAKVKLTSGADPRGAITASLDREGVSAAGLRWGGLRPGTHLLGFRGADGRVRLVSNAAVHATLMQILSAVADVALAISYWLAFRKAGVVRPGIGGENVGCAAILLMFGVLMVRAVGVFIVFVGFVPQGWVAGWRTLVLAACLSALVSPYLALAFPVGVFFLPRFEVKNAGGGDDGNVGVW